MSRVSLLSTLLCRTVCRWCASARSIHKCELSFPGIGVLSYTSEVLPRWKNGICTVFRNVKKNPKNKLLLIF